MTEHLDFYESNLLRMYAGENERRDRQSRHLCTWRGMPFRGYYGQQDYRPHLRRYIRRVQTVGLFSNILLPVLFAGLLTALAAFYLSE